MKNKVCDEDETITIKNQRLLVVTGKGGVGKTTFALSLSKSLKDQGKKVIFAYFEDDPLQNECINELKLNAEMLIPKNCVKEYVISKLGSAVVAGWILATPFFNSLINLVPGFTYLVMLGYLVDKLIIDEELIIVLDSPASGHALTMLESFNNFADFFNSGVLFKDLNRIRNYVSENDLIFNLILGIPNEIAFNEATELKEKLDNLQVGDSKIILNNVLLYPGKDLMVLNCLPQALQLKIKAEQLFMDKYKNFYSHTIRHITDENFIEIVNKCSKEIHLKDFLTEKF